MRHSMQQVVYPESSGTEMDVRVRLRPWLESRLNEGWISGLVWIDKDKSIFRIPWKHHSKHTWSEEDALVFKDWACVTGRYRDGIDNPDWPMWKTRLRCALNKAPDIQEVKQRHNLHCDQPFKVYRFISKTESLWRANASRNACMVFDGIPSSGTLITSPPSPLIRRNYGGTTKLNNSTVLFQRSNSSGIQSGAATRPITLIQRNSDGELVYVKQVHIAVNGPVGLDMNDQQDGNSGVMTSDHLDIGANQEVSGFVNSVSSSDYENTNNYRYYPNNSAAFNNFSPPTTIMRRLSAQVPSNQLTANPNVPFLPDIMEPEMHQLCLRIQHLDIKVKDTIVTNPNGCCIFYGRWDETDSPSAPEPHEPPISPYVQDKNKQYVDLLLDNMQRGVILTVSHGSIYAERLCKCAIFVYVPTSEGDYQFIRKLGRREREKIFDFDLFCEELEYYKAGQRHHKPQYEIILAFGQQLKPTMLCTDGLLVWCRVANCKAWFNLQRIQSSMSPGLHTPIMSSMHHLTPKLEETDMSCVMEEQVIEEGVEVPLEDDSLVYDATGAEVELDSHHS